MTTFILVAGQPGSGKTTLGRSLARRMKAPLVDLDAATAAFVEEARAKRPDLGEAALLAAIRPDRYLELIAAARAAARFSSRVVVTAPFTSEIASDQRWSELVAGLGAEPADVHLVWLSISPEERLRRMNLRGATRDSDLLAEVGGGAQLPDGASPTVPSLHVDASLQVSDMTDAVMSRFDNGSLPA